MSLFKINPSLIHFTSDIIRKQFSDSGKLLSQTLSDLRFNPNMIENIPVIRVVYCPQREKYFSLDNKRLFIFKKLYNEGLIREVPVSLEMMKKIQE